jgi:hypothetical protein
LGSIVGSFKSAVSRICHKKWYEFTRQSRYHDHIVRNETEYNGIKRYIQNNPENRSDFDSVLWEKFSGKRKVAWTISNAPIYST